jgi:hypothetical protein
MSAPNGLKYSCIIVFKIWGPALGCTRAPRYPLQPFVRMHSLGRPLLSLARDFAPKKKLLYALGQLFLCEFMFFKILV